MKNFFLFTAFVLFLSACATDYKPSGFSGGYDDFKLSKNSYLIKFYGNEFTSKDLVYKYALRRAADLTSQHGYKYFKITESSNSVNKRVYKTPLQTETKTSHQEYNGVLKGMIEGHSSTTISGGNTRIYEKLTTSITIKMYHTYVEDAYKASTILSNFNKK